MKKQQVCVQRHGAAGAPLRVSFELDSAMPWPASVNTAVGPLALHAARRAENGGLLGCAVCGHPELYAQKDFPRALGLGVVAVAAVLAPWTHYASLAAAALVDLALHRFAPQVFVCYVCAARHRGFPGEPRHPRFDIEIAERLRYGERAVMGKPMRPGGTAGAPEPEH